MPVGAVGVTTTVVCLEPVRTTTSTITATKATAPRIRTGRYRREDGAEDAQPGPLAPKGAVPGDGTDADSEVGAVSRPGAIAVSPTVATTGVDSRAAARADPHAVQAFTVPAFMVSHAPQRQLVGTGIVGVARAPVDAEEVRSRAAPQAVHAGSFGPFVVPHLVQFQSATVSASRLADHTIRSGDSTAARHAGSRSILAQDHEVVPPVNTG